MSEPSVLLAAAVRRLRGVLDRARVDGRGMVTMPPRFMAAVIGVAVATVGVRSADAAWYIERFGGETCVEITRIPSIANQLNLSLHRATINAPIDLANLYRSGGAVVTQYPRDKELLPERLAYKVVGGGAAPFDLVFYDALNACIAIVTLQGVK